ncbi:hypothetical protein RIR_jg31169.t1 [Rhizophagus irregularis DAOM 181602=DAOM 197198]|nr:hypothetical protein RIR_jg31169.t1 [Rhizophagus irregularis DAOM 181602=DAOM 197198]
MNDLLKDNRYAALINTKNSICEQQVLPQHVSVGPQQRVPPQQESAGPQQRVPPQQESAGPQQRVLPQQDSAGPQQVPPIKQRVSNNSHCNK